MPETGLAERTGAFDVRRKQLGSVHAPQTVKTARLTGRRIAADDLPYLREVDSDARVQRSLFGKVQTLARSRERLRRWILMWEEDGTGFWLFVDDRGQTIGHGGLFRSPREAGEIELGYVVKPAHWGHGFATEIALRALDVGFTDLALERIIAIAQARNAESRHVMEKCGMLFEADLPSPDGVHGVRYAVSRSAWLRGRER